MSGICGILRFDGQNVTSESIFSAVDALKNRGNDEQNILLDGKIALAHKALWTTPESRHEKQPARAYQEPQLVITADARLDNRDELITSLGLHKANDGVITDIDIILAAYLEWASDCVYHLVGDYAFAIWDARYEHLFCVRDRLGIRPFNYNFNGSQFIFASEIKPIFAGGQLHKELDTETARRFLGFDPIPKTATFFKGINRLPPATYMMVSREGIQSTKYWDLKDIQGYRNISLEDAASKLRQLLSEAVKACMRTDQHIGCEISGGLDSSSILGIANTLKLKKNLVPLSMRFEGLNCDESLFSDAVGLHHDLDIVTINCAKLDFKEKYCLESYYERFPDWPSIKLFMPTLAIEERASEMNVGVILTGQGGDHIMDGNYLFLADYFIKFKWNMLLKAVKDLPNKFSYFKLAILKPLLPDSWIRRMKSVLGPIGLTGNAGDHVDPTAGSDINKSDYQFISQWDDALSIEHEFHALWADITPYQYAGKYGVEFRHPFFNSRLVEFMQSLPPELKWRKGKTKYLLRHALGSMLPKIVADREDKAEFSEIIYAQINALNANDLEVPLAVAKSGLVDQTSLSSLLNEFHEGSQSIDRNELLWNAVNFLSWYRVNFELDPDTGV